jgi:putative hydrolase of the HAD superfamily
MPYQKPHPTAFETALRALGVEVPDTAVFVGDRLWDDVFGAQRAGLRAVLRRNPHVSAYDVEPDAVIDALPELVDVVDGWRRR